VAKPTQTNKDKTSIEGITLQKSKPSVFKTFSIMNVKDDLLQMISFYIVFTGICPDFPEKEPPSTETHWRTALRSQHCYETFLENKNKKH
jgi:hypothetical protein